MMILIGYIYIYIYIYISTYTYIYNVGKTMPFLPPMTGNGKHPTYKNGDDWGIVYYCFTNINGIDGVVNSTN